MTDETKQVDLDALAAEAEANPGGSVLWRSGVAAAIIAELRELRAYKARREQERCETCAKWPPNNCFARPCPRSPFCPTWHCADWMARNEPSR